MYKVGIVKVTDRGFKREREDTNVRVIRDIIRRLGWEIASYQVIPDELEVIVETLIRHCDQGKLDLVLTTGGTGFSPGDNTPEATKAIMEREVPGLAEVMRLQSLKKTPRATADIRRRSLIVNLPGSPRVAAECLEAIIPALPYGLEMLTGCVRECAR